MSGKEMKQIMIFTKNPLNFNDSMAGWKDNDIHDLL